MFILTPNENPCIRSVGLLQQITADIMVKWQRFIFSNSNSRFPQDCLHVKALKPCFPQLLVSPSIPSLEAMSEDVCTSVYSLCVSVSFSVSYKVTLI